MESFISLGHGWPKIISKPPRSAALNTLVISTICLIKSNVRVSNTSNRYVAGYYLCRMVLP